MKKRKQHIFLVFLCIGFLLFSVLSTFTLSAQSTNFRDKIKTFYENGLKALNYGQISEAIEKFVTVLAEADKYRNLDKESRSIVTGAEAKLLELGTSLNLEPSPEWMDAAGNQISGSTGNIGEESTLQPSVILTLNTGTGRVVVPGAPIQFAFKKGSGLLTGTVTTSDYGQANATVIDVENPGREIIITASLQFRVKGYEYDFETVQRDFVYVPPEHTATILVLEKCGNSYSENPVILDDAYRVLERLDVEFSPFNGVLIGNDFLSVYNGDQNLVKEVGSETGVSYLFVILSDVHTVNQLKYGDKVYDIWKSSANATARIIRVDDGRILYSQGVVNVGGQGGTRQKAMRDGFLQASSELIPKLSDDLQKISRLIAQSD